MPATDKWFRDELKKIGLGLENRLQDRVGLLSGGQRQALTMLMATLVRPKVLLLDEHIAALDPKTAEQILTLTREIIEDQGLTALMITHNMRHAITFGNRLIMLHQGKVILDVQGAEKHELSVEDLLEQFYLVQGEELANDSMLPGLICFPALSQQSIPVQVLKGMVQQVIVVDDYGLQVGKGRFPPRE